MQISFLYSSSHDLCPIITDNEIKELKLNQVVNKLFVPYVDWVEVNK